MSSLENLQINDTFPGLIKTNNEAAVDGTLRTLQDGAGNNLPMQVSTTGVNFTGTVTGIPVGGVQSILEGTNITVDATDPFNPIVSATGGGGGGPAVTGYNSLRGFGIGTATSVQEQWKVSYYGTSYSSTGITVSGRKVKLAAMALYEGGIINEFSIYVTTAAAETTIEAVIYKAELNANGQIIATTLEANLGTIDVSSTGQKIITGINHTLGTTVDGIYFVGIYNGSTNNVGINGIASTGVGGGVLSSSLYATTIYRGNTYSFNEQSSLPVNLSSILTFLITKDTDFPLFGVRS